MTKGKNSKLFEPKSAEIRQVWNVHWLLGVPMTFRGLGGKAITFHGRWGSNNFSGERMCVCEMIKFFKML